MHRLGRAREAAPQEPVAGRADGGSRVPDSGTGPDPGGAAGGQGLEGPGRHPPTPAPPSS